MRPFRPCAVAVVALSLFAAHAVPAQAACKRFGFLVNDYGKEGPANDAKALLDTQVKKWADEKGITNYKVGKKQVTCELFLDVGLFDEYTCTAKANVCWGDGQTNAAADGSASGNNDALANDADLDFEMPPAPVRKAKVAPETAVPVVAGQDAAQNEEQESAQGAAKEEAAMTAEQAAEEAEAAAEAAVAEAETAAREAAAAEATSTPETEAAQAKPAVPSTSAVETGALPTDARAAAAEVAKSSAEMSEAATDAEKEKAAAKANERAAAAQAAAAAERAAKAAEQAAAAAKAAAAAAIAASEASQGPVVPKLKQAD